MKYFKFLYYNCSACQKKDVPIVVTVERQHQTSKYGSLLTEVNYFCSTCADAKNVPYDKKKYPVGFAKW